MSINYTNINEFSEGYNIPTEQLTASFSLQYPNIIEIGNLEAVKFDIYKQGITELKNIYTEFYIDNNNIDINDYIQSQEFDIQDILPNKVISMDISSYTNQNLITPTEGIQLQFGSGVFIKIDYTDTINEQIQDGIEYNVYLKHSSSLIEDINFKENNNILVLNGSTPEEFSDNYIKLNNETIDLNDLKKDLTPLISSIFLRDNISSSKIGNYKKLNFVGNESIIQVAKGFKKNDILSVINFNPFEYNNMLSENLFRFDTIILVPIRTELIDMTLNEIIIKKLLQKKLNQKLIEG